jgi:hypothetical protein
LWRLDCRKWIQGGGGSFPNPWGLTSPPQLGVPLSEEEEL